MGSGTWKSGSEQNTSDKSAENRGLGSGRLQATSRESTGGNKVIYYLGRCTMRFLLGLLEAGQRTELLRITRTMSESSITDGLTCVFIIVTPTRCPGTPTQLSGGHLHIGEARLCAESGTQGSGVHGWLALHAWFKFWDAAIWDVDRLVFIECHGAVGKKMQRWSVLKKFTSQNDDIVKNI